MLDVLTLGAATRDVFLRSKQFQLINSPRFESGVGECVSLGGKIDVDELLLTTGGGATNAAVTFARLGFTVAAACRVGDDGAGRDVVADLLAEGVDTRRVRRVRGTTGYATILTAEGGERAILVHRGVSSTFVPTDIPAALGARWLYATSLGGNLRVLTRAFSTARRSGADVAWNPGQAEIRHGLDALRPLLRRTRVLILNREEAGALTGKETVDDMLIALGTDKNAVVVTDGERGAYARLDGRTAFVPAGKTRAVSRTGAGDAFGSGFVAGYARTGDLYAALALGSLNAESVVSETGAKAGILRGWPSKRTIERTCQTIR